MPTLKTVKSVTRRFKVTGTGKVLASRAGRRHLLTGRRAKSKRRLRRRRALAGAEVRRLGPFLR